MTSNMRKEIFEQPQLILEKTNYWLEEAQKLNSLFLSKRNIVLIGRGSSGNACVFASYIIGLKTGRHPLNFRPWLATQNTPDSNWDDSVVISYSQSGESTDIIKATKWLKDRGATIIGLSNNKNSTLENISDGFFFLNVEKELAVPATKTFSMQLVASASLAGVDISLQSKSISESMTNYLNSSFSKELAEFANSKNTILWIGRGLSQASALDSALKMQETVNFTSFGYSSAEFLHGPIGSTRKDTGVIIFNDSDKESTTINKIIQILKNRSVEYRILDINSIKMPEDKWARAILFALIGQYTALLTAELRNVDPDQPQDLNKITFT